MHQLFLLDSQGVEGAGDDHEDRDEDLEGVDGVATPDRGLGGRQKHPATLCKMEREWDMKDEGEHFN